MNLLPPNFSPSPVFLPEELVVEVLSFLPVKSLLRLRCVSKSWKSFISDPTFVKRHLNRSALNADFTLVSSWNEVSFTTFCLLENPPIITTLPNGHYRQLNDKYDFYIVGSCNGLLCLLADSCILGNTDKHIRVWNPATRTISEKLGYSYQTDLCYPLSLTFGYDDSTDTYKVVHFIPDTTMVRVFSLGHNVWRKIQNSPLDHDFRMDVVNLSGSFNWLAVHDYTRKRVITSLDLSTETHTHFLPPQGVDEEPFINPNLSVLNECLCFSRDFKQTHFVIWQMKKFGVEDSWTLILKIRYNNLQIFHLFPLLPLCLLEKNDTLLLIDELRNQMIHYNWRYNIAKRFNVSWQFNSKNYVESLVWYC
ncbi:F-box/kelch-repeat protein At3g06240-like [Vicia villosa]|uniref:F-box/kelch-repeat protein At3g06240-like n=1 Tax=Vicia villosa TaxID=3911 RepID=UPI00273C69F9|nr:F-box/kelch-repeat protein At3g06240-like [Vicia villosa]